MQLCLFTLDIQMVIRITFARGFIKSMK